MQGRKARQFPKSRHFLRIENASTGGLATVHDPVAYFRGRPFYSEAPGDGREQFLRARTMIRQGNFDPLRRLREVAAFEACRLERDRTDVQHEQCASLNSGLRSGLPKHRRRSVPQHSCVLLGR